MENHNLVPTRYVDGLPGPGLGYSTFPQTIPSSDPHVLLKPVTVLQGYKMFQCYEPIYTRPLLPTPSYPHQQNIDDVVVVDNTRPLFPTPSYAHRRQQLLSQESVPLSSSYQQNIDDVVVVDLDVTFTTDDHERDYRAATHSLLPIPSYAHGQQQRLTREPVSLPSSYLQNIDDVVVVDLDVTVTTDDHERDSRATRMKKEADLKACLEIKRHSSFTNQSSEASSDRGMCIVCLSEYEENEKIGSIKNCGHQYHLGCIKKWLMRKNLCPICKGTAFAKGGMVIKPRERRSGDHTNWL